MIKCRRGPAIGAVADCTVVIEIISDMVRVCYSIEICLMTAEAVRWCILVPVGVTSNTLQRDVCPCKWETKRSMIKIPAPA